MLYFCGLFFGCGGGAVVTASHVPVSFRCVCLTVLSDNIRPPSPSPILLLLLLPPKCKDNSRQQTRQEKRNKTKHKHTHTHTRARTTTTERHVVKKENGKDETESNNRTGKAKTQKQGTVAKETTAYNVRERFLFSFARCLLPPLPPLPPPPPPPPFSLRRLSIISLLSFFSVACLLSDHPFYVLVPLSPYLLFFSVLCFVLGSLYVSAVVLCTCVSPPSASAARLPSLPPPIFLCVFFFPASVHAFLCSRVCLVSVLKTFVVLFFFLTSSFLPSLPLSFISDSVVCILSSSSSFLAAVCLLPSVLAFTPFSLGVVSLPPPLSLLSVCVYSSGRVSCCVALLGFFLSSDSIVSNHPCRFLPSLRVVFRDILSAAPFSLTPSDSRPWTSAVILLFLVLRSFCICQPSTYFSFYTTLAS